jgi:hypothetical protein
MTFWAVHSIHAGLFTLRYPAVDARGDGNDGDRPGIAVGRAH